jgi:hypothetical protein
MRNPRGNFQIALTLGLTGAVVAAVTFRPNGEEISLQGWVGLAALVVAVMGLLWALVALPYARSFARLRRGKGVFARWTVQSGQWQEFVELSRRNFDPKKMWPNQLNLRREPPASGVEVAVSDDAVLVGGDFHYMPFTAAVTIHESWIEFDHFNAGSVRGGSHHVVVRFPIAPGAERIAAEIVERRRGGYASAVQNYRRKWLIALAIFLLITGLLLFLFWSDL